MLARQLFSELVEALGEDAGVQQQAMLKTVISALIGLMVSHHPIKVLFLELIENSSEQIDLPNLLCQRLRKPHTGIELRYNILALLQLVLFQSPLTEAALGKYHCFQGYGEAGVVRVLVEAHSAQWEIYPLAEHERSYIHITSAFSHGAILTVHTDQSFKRYSDSM